MRLKFCLGLLFSWSFCFHLAADDQLLVVKAAGIFDSTSGKMLSQRQLLIKNGLVEQIRAEDAAIPENAQVLDYSDAFITPGFIDAHVHLASGVESHGYGALGISLPAATIYSVANAKKTLKAGVTTVRVVGSPGYAGVALRDAINNGVVAGPRILTAGIAIGITGGHCSDNNLLPFEAGAVGDGVADGPWAARAMVRQNIKFGADVIKTCSTGGVLSKGTEVGAPQSTVEELSAIVSEAHSHGRKVASHAHGATGIKNAINAGVDSIEHASFIDAEGIRLAKKNGTALVMDIYVTEYILGEGEAAGILPESLEKERKVGRIQRENFRKAHNAGVRIVFGTDAGVYPHGDNLKQLSRMVDWGMTPAEALQAATVHAAELLGLVGQVGVFEPGAHADFIVLEESPLLNISTVEQPVSVFKSGKLVQ